MSKMLEEIISQKDCLLNTISKNKQKVFELAKIIKQSKKKYFEILARGSSRNASLLFKYELESSSDYRVSFIYPSTISKYNGNINPDSIILAVSQGGRGEDIKIVLQNAKKNGAFCIAITNEKDSPIAKIADFTLFLNVGKELAMAATKSFTSEMLVLQMLSNALIGKKNDYLSNITCFIDQIQINELKKFIQPLKSISNLYVLTRGKLFAIGQEMTCKLQETCFINSHTYATSDFMHGPLALVDSDFISLILIPNDETKEDVILLNNKILENGGKTYIISNTKINATKLFLIPNIEKEQYVYYVLFVCQFIACYLADLRQCNPDKSRNLDKYTKTI